MSEKINQESFVNLEELLPRLKTRLEEDAWQDRTSSALFHLLSAYKEKIEGLTPSYFHKAFRQIDVTDNGHIDSAIWQLLNESKTFWEVFTELYLADT